MTVKKENRLLTNSYSAVVKGRQSVEIRPQVSGTITEICVKEGAKVHKGQVLFVIDQVPYKAALQTAFAEIYAGLHCSPEPASGNFDGLHYFRYQVPAVYGRGRCGEMSTGRGDHV